MCYIFFGSGRFAQLVLENLLEEKIRPVLIITFPPKAKGRKQVISPNPIHLLALREKIPVLTPLNLKEKEFVNQFCQSQPQLVILTDYGKIIPPELLTVPQKGFLNLHPSLLPRWRGASPIQSAIIHGDKITGASVILMNDKIDQGPILAKVEFKIQDSEITYEELLKKLSLLGVKLLKETISRWLKGEIIPQPQNNSLAVYCYKFEKKDAKIDWTKNMEEIIRQIRALNPEPGTYTHLPTDKTKIICKIIKVKKCQTIDTTSYQLGEVFLTKDKKIAVKCSDGALILEFIQPAGRKLMTAESFLRGNQWLIGKILK